MCSESHMIDESLCFQLLKIQYHNKSLSSSARVEWMPFINDELDTMAANQVQEFVNLTSDWKPIDDK